MKKAVFLLFLLTFCVSLSDARTVYVRGDIAQDARWAGGVQYVLQGVVTVRKGVTLTLEPGTVVLGDKTTKGMLLVQRGGRLIAEGTPTDPIVFTSSEEKPTSGDWGGVVLMGEGSVQGTYAGLSNLARLQTLQGPPVSDLLYGGGERPEGPLYNDSSGIIRYVRIEYAGADYATGDRLAALTLAGVGSSTRVEYVQVVQAAGDGFRFLGGSPNVKYLVSYHVGDEDFECDQGYVGFGQFLWAIRHPQRAEDTGSSAFELKSGMTAPYTAPVFSNVTIVGPTGKIHAGYKQAVVWRGAAQGRFHNSAIVGRFPTGFFFDGQAAAYNVQAQRIEIASTFVNGSEQAVQSNGTWEPSAWYANAARFNQWSADSNAVRLMQPFRLDAPNALAAWNSPLNNAAAFSATGVSTMFFLKVRYAGAFGTTDWTCGWAAFPGLPANRCFTDTHVIPSSEQSVTAVLTPTIADAQTILRITGLQADKAMWLLYDVHGHLWQKTAFLPAANAEVTVQTAQLPAGQYFLQILSQSYSKTLPMVVVH